MKLLLVTIALLAITAQTNAIKQEFKVIPFDDSKDTWNVTAGCAISCGGSSDIATDVEAGRRDADGMIIV